MLPEYIRKKQLTLEVRKRELKLRATKSEIRILSLLKQIGGGKVMFQKGLISGNNYCIVDFYIPRFGLCIEIDGGYHNTPEQKSRDEYKDKYILRERKMSVLRIPNAIADVITAKELDELMRGHTRHGISMTHRKKWFLKKPN
jgi:very-short-patch-repair endonuclease